jgi:hypothetical protein
MPAVQPAGRRRVQAVLVPVPVPVLVLVLVLVLMLVLVLVPHGLRVLEARGRGGRVRAVAALLRCWRKGGVQRRGGGQPRHVLHAQHPPHQPLAGEKEKQRKTGWCGSQSTTA